MRTGITVFSLDKRVRDLEEKLTKDIPQGSVTVQGEFDYTTPFYCNLCEKKMPKILEEYHAHIKHGI